MKERLAVLCRQALRVPLDSQDGQRPVHQSFDHIVPGAADRNQILSRAVYGLMVGGVYRSAVSI